MDFLLITQSAAAAALFALALTHLLVWIRATVLWGHFLFALAAAAGGANALAEAYMYRADSIDTMCNAVKLYVATSGVWGIATIVLVAYYSKVGRVGRGLTIAIVITFAIALIMNAFSPASFLYTRITELRQIVLPWDEAMRLPVGDPNPIRILFELASVAFVGVAVDGGVQLWKRGQRTKGVVFAGTVITFIVCFGTHAFFVDTGRLDSPYLSMYGFLALVGLMSFELAGEVMRMAQLTTELKEKELELQSAIELERKRIAGDLHDSVTQTLFSTAAIADALPEVWQRRPEEAMKGLNDLKHLTRGALAEMRTLLLELRPAALLDKKCGTLIKQLCEATAGRSRIAISIDIENDQQLPPDIQFAFYRVSQGALTNIVKHAQASKVEARFKCQDHEVCLEIVDDGCGFDVEGIDGKGMGISIMRERARSIGGDLELTSEPKTGTRLSLVWRSNS